MTKAQGEALTALLHQLRKDWDAPGIRAALQRAQALGSATDVAVAACRVAGNQDARTPALIAEPGAHWQGTAVGKRQTHPVCDQHHRPLGRCADCDRESAPPPPNLRELVAAARERQDGEA